MSTKFFSMSVIALYDLFGNLTSSPLKIYGLGHARTECQYMWVQISLCISNH